MVILALVLLVAVLGFSLALLSRFSHQVQANPAYVDRALRTRRHPRA